MKKPPSKVRLAVRELQLVLSVGCALLILYSVVFGSLVLRFERPHTDNEAVLVVLSLLLSRGPLLVLAPLLCFATRWVVDVNPWRLGLGTALFVEFMFQLLRWVTGGFDEPGVFNATLVLQILCTMGAGVLAGLAARRAATLVTAHMARQEAEAAKSPTAAAPSVDLAEQMRQIQSQASAPAPTVDEAKPAPTGTEPPKS